MLNCFYCEHGHYMWSPNFVRFALSLNVYEISANLCCFLFFSKNLKFQKCFAVIIYNHCDPQICPFRSISLKMATIHLILCLKLISASFKYSGCSYKILNRFIQLFSLHRGSKIFFKLSNLTLGKIKFNPSKQHVK